MVYIGRSILTNYLRASECVHFYRDSRTHKNTPKKNITHDLFPVFTIATPHLRKQYFCVKLESTHIQSGRIQNLTCSKRM